MKQQDKQLNGQRGFSLIELMIVVAIIGILSAIAVPNFQRFRAKSRQAEARSNLSAYYTAAKASFAELGFYAGNFTAVGFQPEGELNYVITGADNASNPPAPLPNEDDCVSTGTSVAATTCATVTWTPLLQTATGGARDPALAEAVADATFLVSAGGRIGAAVTDAWTINQQKTLTNTTSGLP